MSGPCGDACIHVAIERDRLLARVGELEAECNEFEQCALKADADLVIAWDRIHALEAKLAAVAAAKRHKFWTTVNGGPSAERDYILASDLDAAIEGEAE
jgi:hypothetical protein